MNFQKKSLALMVAVQAAVLASSVNAQIEEVVITAELRETALQETPLAVTAMSGEMLEARNFTNLSQISAQAPNVSLTQAGAGSGPSMLAFIRGVGQTDFNYAVEPGVGIYVDEVYFPTLTGTLLELLDLERVEILRGPQGTLAGRNSIGGAVKLFTQKPGDEAGGRFSATLGSYERTDIAGAADFTIDESSLWARVSGISRSENGYLDRLDYRCMHPDSGVPTFLAGGDVEGCRLGTEGGRQVTAVRAALRWMPSADLEVNLSYDRTNEDSEVPATVLLQVNEAVNRTNGYGAGTFIPSTIDGSPIYYDNKFVTHGRFRGDTRINSPYVNYATYLDPNPATPTRPYSPVSVPPIQTLDQYGVAATVDWILSDTMALKSITAYREYQSSFAQDVDASPINSQMLLQHLEHNQLSQELRLSGTMFNDLLDYTLGGFWFEQDGTLEANVNLYYAQLNFIHGPDPTPSDTRAIFVNTAWHLTDSLNLTLGMRYSEDEKDYVFFRRNPDGTLPPPCLAPPPANIANPANCALNGLFNQVGHFEDERTDWRAALDYNLSDDMMLYAQASTGYKAGGVNPRPFFIVQIESVAPEEITSYEVGFKSSWLSRTVQLNAAAFFNDYQDIQLQQTQCEVPFPPFFGAPCLQPGNAGDADVKGFEVEAQVDLGGWLFDASLSTLDFEYTRVSPNVAVTRDMTTPFTPELKYAVGAQYEYTMGNGSLLGRLDYSWQDDIYANPTNAPTNLIDDYGVLNGRVTWRSFNQNWEVSVEANNITDEVYYLNIFDQFFSSGTVAATVAKPRTYALTLKHLFQ